MRLKAILVDDEIHIVRNLQTVISWETMNIEIVGTARNGMEALELSTEHMPDIILSDIRMPLMDGITFVGKLRELNEACEIVMVTGYQDFDNIRSLLKHGVSDYILKPIDYEDLEQTIGKMAQKIRSKKLELLIQEKKWGVVKTLAYEKILYDGLMNYIRISPGTLLPLDEMDIDNNSYQVYLIDLDDYSHKSLQWDAEERKLWNFAIRNVLLEALKLEQPHYSVLQMREGEWCLLMETRHNEFELSSTHTCQDWMEQIQTALNLNVKLSVSIGVYPLWVQFNELSNVYKRLQRMMQLYPEKHNSTWIFKEQGELSDSNVSLWNFVEEIIAGLKHVDKQKTEDAWASLKQMMESLPSASFARASQILHFLILHLLREMREMHSIDGAVEEAIWRQLDHCEGIPDLLKVMKALVEQGHETNQKKKNSDILMESAKTYIRLHFSTDFGIDEIAESLGISSSYFSLLFKQHFGETFVEYVTKHRMEHAKSLLLMSDKSITDIGKSVGFAERRYFTKVFQKFTGEIPSEYRDKRKQTP